MYAVSYISKKGEVLKVQAGGNNPSQARSIVKEIYKDCAKVLFVTNIYSGEVVG